MCGLTATARRPACFIAAAAAAAVATATAAAAAAVATAAAAAAAAAAVAVVVVTAVVVDDATRERLLHAFFSRCCSGELKSKTIKDSACSREPTDC